MDDGCAGRQDRAAVAAPNELPPAPGFRQKLAHVVQQVGRCRGNAVDRAKHFFSADRADIDPELPGFLEIDRVAMRGEECRLQCLGSRWRCTGRSGERP